MKTTETHLPTFNRETANELYELSLRADIITLEKKRVVYKWLECTISKQLISMAAHTANHYTAM